MHKTFEKKA